MHLICLEIGCYFSKSISLLTVFPILALKSEKSPRHIPHGSRLFGGVLLSLLLHGFIVALHPVCGVGSHSIGLFILLIGLLDAGIIQMTAGFPELGDMGSLRVITSLPGLLVVTILTVLNVRGSLMIGMLITAW